MIRAQEPDVCRRGRYTKAEACRKLGEKDKPITVQTLNRWIVRLGISPILSMSQTRAYITGADIICIWRYS